jgi:hypothetical protein
MVTPDEKLELVELLEHRTRSSFIVRPERCIAAEVRLGMWENGSLATVLQNWLRKRAT